MRKICVHLFLSPVVPEVCAIVPELLTTQLSHNRLFQLLLQQSGQSYSVLTLALSFAGS